MLPALLALKMTQKHYRINNNLLTHKLYCQKDKTKKLLIHKIRHTATKRKVYTIHDKSHRRLSNTHYANYSCMTSNVKDDDKYSVTIMLPPVVTTEVSTFCYSVRRHVTPWHDLVSLRSWRNWRPVWNVRHSSRSRTSTKHTSTHTHFTVIGWLHFLD